VSGSEPAGGEAWGGEDVGADLLRDMGLAAEAPSAATRAPGSVAAQRPPRAPPPPLVAAGERRGGGGAAEREGARRVGGRLSSAASSAGSVGSGRAGGEWGAEPSGLGKALSFGSSPAVLPDLA
jgi:hypothetical protein